jgi:hypothetical protein
VLKAYVSWKQSRASTHIQISFDQTKVGSLPCYGFRGVYVFDTQTEGADLPEFEHQITMDVGEHRAPIYLLKRVTLISSLWAASEVVIRPKRRWSK